jgi:hypothetical protein
MAATGKDTLFARMALIGAGQSLAAGDAGQ